MRIKINTLIILALAAGFFVPLQSMADVPAEMKALKRSVGTWKIEQTTKTADGQEVKVTGYTTTRFVLGGRYLEYVTHTNPGEQESLGIFTYDEAKKKYRSWFFTSRGQHSEWSGTWDEKTKTLTRTAKLQRGNTATATSKFVDDDTMDFSIVGRRPDGRIIFELKSTSTRLPNAKPVVHKRSEGPATSPAELKSLDRLVGRWSDEAVMKVAVWTPEQVRFKSDSEKFWTLGGKCVVQQSKDALFLTTFSAVEKAVKMWHFNAAGYVHEWTGNWDDENALTLKSDLDGNPTVTSTLQQKFVGNDTTTWTVIAKDKAGKVYHHLQGTSKRRK